MKEEFIKAALAIYVMNVAMETGATTQHIGDEKIAERV